MNLLFFLIAIFFAPTLLPSSEPSSFPSTFTNFDTFIVYDPQKNEPVFTHGSLRNSERASPCSSFKLPLAFIGYELGILKTEFLPLYTYQDGDEPPHPFISPPKGPLSPQNWISQSAVWYSQILTRAIGKEAIERFLLSFSYGNQDMSGDEGKDNGLTNAWLCSSLKISVQEQVNFLNRLLLGKTLIRQATLEKGKKILFIKDMGNGWKLYGKTGSGCGLDAEGKYLPSLRQGWFVGWIEKNGYYITFASKRLFPKELRIDPALFAYGEGRLAKEQTILWLEEWTLKDPLKL